MLTSFRSIHKHQQFKNFVRPKSTFIREEFLVKLIVMIALIYIKSFPPNTFLFVWLVSYFISEMYINQKYAQVSSASLERWPDCHCKAGQVHEPNSTGKWAAWFHGRILLCIRVKASEIKFKDDISQVKTCFFFLFSSFCLRATSKAIFK